MERGVAVVIEDDNDVRAALAAIFRQAGFAVHQASSGAEGLDQVRTHNPDIVTLDIGLPDFDGLEASRRIRTFSDAYVVIISGRADEADALLGFEAGADDYIVKPFRARELRARIKAMLRRPRASSPGGAGSSQGDAAAGSGDGTFTREATYDSFDYVHKGLALHEGTRQAAVDGVPVALTRSQFDILLVLMKKRRTIQAKADLVRYLRHDSYDGSFVGATEERAVEVHVSNLRKRLGENPRKPRWVETVHGVGYRLTPPVPRRQGRQQD
ncbi:response regulator transcription factor [Pseudarthrobacter sp. MEB009]|uniref:response regulator transcription factor n=1 Tax=Pseudarthrobacter sp. MEB009 TaxID=3040326 RepID=UPI002555E5A3|nr:response regulator transcription factor [Pseudarthrobacter sp. MEB009]